MLDERIEKIMKDANALFRKLNKIEKFTDKYNLTPSREVHRVIGIMQSIAADIPHISNPQNLEQLLQSELKKRLIGEAVYLDQRVNGKLYDFNTMVSILGIPQEDIHSLRPWLEENKEKTQDAVERLFHSKDIEEYELPLAADIPSVRRQVEEFAGAHIQRYHKAIGKFLQGRTQVGEYLRDINAVPTTQDRSYFNQLTNTLALSIPRICFSKEDGTLHMRDKELIRLYGHEGMGHALNFVVTRSHNLDYFLKHASILTVSTAESVAQFYENVLLEDLKKSPETQRALNIEHIFAEIYQEAKDTEQLEEYKKRIFQYGISVLADKSFGKSEDSEVIKKKTELLNEVSIDKSSVQYLMQQTRRYFDSEGNLDYQIVGELRYCARPVQRALEEFAKKGIDYNDEKGRSMIDTTFLKGLWTPIGFVDNARIRAESK